MSSIIRRIQRMAAHKAWVPGRKEPRLITVEGRNKSGSGVGSRLGVKNPKDPCITGKRKARKAWRSPKNAPPPKAKIVLKASNRPRRNDLADAHRAKMDSKRRDRQRVTRTQLPSYFVPASANHRTGKPHEHRREIARRQRRGEG